MSFYFKKHGVVVGVLHIMAVGRGRIVVNLAPQPRECYELCLIPDTILEALQKGRIVVA